jgi:outer membrane protein OmpA-like peptidoglycan-associated protein
MSLFNYSKAVVFLQEALKSKNPETKREATFLLAECYRKQNDIENANLWYGKSVELADVDPLTWYYYAQSLRSSGDYREARKMFLQFDSVVPKDPRGMIYSDYCDSAVAWQGRKPHFEINNITAINTSQSEFGAVFYKNGVVFASDRILSKQEERTYGWTGYNFLRLFFTEPARPDSLRNNFSGPVPFTVSGEQNWHEGPASFNQDFSEIFINRTLFNKDQGKKDPDRIRTHLLKIFVASLKDGKWSKPQPFFLNSDEYSVGHPALSADGKTLYFVSDMAGGLGGTDIYMCRMEAGKWSHPVNLGGEVNTFGNEMFPYMADSGDLYFSSDGLPGFGGLDLFLAHQVDGKWTKPENLGQPVNSSYDDFSLATIDSKTGLFSSNRPGGLGSDDIYSFTLLPPILPIPPIPTPFISGCVKDKTTEEPIPEATVFFLDKDQCQVLIIKTNEKGCFRTPVKKDRSYICKAMKTPYLPDCLSFRIDTLNKENDLSIPRDLLLDKLEMNKRFTLENIFYDFDRWNIRPDAEPSLNNLVRILKENPVTVELGSHTDCRGSEEYNRILSQKRAESAVRYIVHNGIDPGRIIAKGYGKSQLINRCNCAAGKECTPAEHQANRRTEFRIIGLSDQKIDRSFEPESFKAGDILNVREFPEAFFGECKGK